MRFELQCHPRHAGGGLLLKIIYWRRSQTIQFPCADSNGIYVRGFTCRRNYLETVPTRAIHLYFTIYALRILLHYFLYGGMITLLFISDIHSLLIWILEKNNVSVFSH